MRIQIEKAAVNSLSSELHHRSEVVLSVEDQIHQMDELIQQEQSELQALRKEVTKLQKLKAEESQALAKSSVQEKQLSVELQVSYLVWFYFVSCLWNVFRFCLNSAMAP